MRTRGATLLIGMLMTSAAAADDGIEVSHAWTPAPSRVGTDTPLYMTIVNHGATPDNLLRARCPVANFSVKFTTDHGEGAPTLREVKAIAVPAGATTALAPDGFTVMLVQTREPLQTGQSFTCTVTFQQGGAKDVSVAVASEGAMQAP